MIKSIPRRVLFKHAIMCLLLLFLVAACSQAAEEVAVVNTATPEAPTDVPTEIPTELPTETPTEIPTETPTELPTETPTEIPTETPTELPTETPTEIPTETNTPLPTNIPAPVNTSTPEPPATPDVVTLYYVSNPNDILGTFPVRPFDAAGIKQNMNTIRNSLTTMRNNLDGAKNGDVAACTAYVNAYNNTLYSGVFYDPVPVDWQEIDEIYYISFIYSLDRTRPAYLSCVNSGKVDDFNYGLALQSINQTLNFLEPGINAASVK